MPIVVDASAKLGISLARRTHSRADFKQDRRIISLFIVHGVLCGIRCVLEKADVVHENKLQYISLIARVVSKHAVKPNKPGIQNEGKIISSVDLVDSETRHLDFRCYNLLEIAVSG